MRDNSHIKNVFRELEEQNYDVAKAFHIFRQHDKSKQIDFRLDIDRIHHSHMIGDSRSGINIACFLMRSINLILFLFILLLGIIAIIDSHIVSLISNSVTKNAAVIPWHGILLLGSGMCIGAGIIILAIRIGTSPLHSVTPPKVETEKPLQELKELAERTTSRLRSAYRLQIYIVSIVGMIFIGLIIWSMIMVSQDRILYASAFGSGSIAMMILTRWKWQPFDKINNARKLADNADALATGLHLRMKSISEIADPAERAKAQWEAVKEYLEFS